MKGVNNQGTLVLCLRGPKQETESLTKRIGRDFSGLYHIQKQIGTGAFSLVYLARNQKGQDIALKVMKPGLYDNHDEAEAEFYREMFERESTLHTYFAEKLPDKIVNIYDYGVHIANGTHLPFMALELMSTSLSFDFIAKNHKEYELKDKVSMVKDIADAVACMHKDNTMHGDLKPQNFLFSPNVIEVKHSGKREHIGDRTVKLTDFGLVASPDKSEPSNYIKFTLPYAAPEQVLCSQPDIRSDVYSLGVVLYELVNGERPRQESSGITESFENVKNFVLSPVKDFTPKNPQEAELKPKIMNCLVQKPEERYQSAQEVSDALGEFLQAS